VARGAIIVRLHNGGADRLAVRNPPVRRRRVHVVEGVNAHVSGTLYVIYLIQAATAVLPFPVALVVFRALGYGDAVVLAVVGAIFQFLLLLGQGVLALGLEVIDHLGSLTHRPVAVAILGPIRLGLVPALVVRPQIASREAKLPVSRQFVGFTGGVLTAIGVIAGSLVIAVLVGVLELLIEVPSIPEQ